MTSAQARFTRFLDVTMPLRRPMTVLTTMKATKPMMQRTTSVVVICYSLSWSEVAVVVLLERLHEPQQHAQLGERQMGTDLRLEGVGVRDGRLPFQVEHVGVGEGDVHLAF